MSAVQYREATKRDIPIIAKLRGDKPNEEYWNFRVSGYFNAELHPQMALLPRIIYVAIVMNVIVGFIAGHLTKRFNCEGELQWINVIPEYRKTDIAPGLLGLLAQWFVKQNAFYICVDVGSESGRRFYLKNGATNLNEHWMVWKDIRNILSN